MKSHFFPADGFLWQMLINQLPVFEAASVTGWLSFEWKEIVL